MTGAGWFIMLVSLTSVISLLAFSLFRVFNLPTLEAEEHIQTQPFIDTHDTLDAD